MVFLILPGLCQSIAVDMTETFQSSLFQGMGVLCLGSVQSHLKVEDKTTTISQMFAVVHEVPMEASYLNGTKHDTAIMSLLHGHIYTGICALILAHLKKCTYVCRYNCGCIKCQAAISNFHIAAKWLHCKLYIAKLSLQTVKVCVKTALLL